MIGLPPLLTIEQTAELIGLKPATLRDWRKKHTRQAKLDPKIKKFVAQFVKVGSAVRVPSEAVERFLGNQRADASTSTVDNYGPAILSVLESILDALKKMQPVTKKSSKESGKNLGSTLEAAWKTWIEKKVSPPIYHFTLAPKKPSSEKTLRDRFDKLLCRLAADNDEQRPKAFVIVEKGERPGGEHRLHLHALVGGIENMTVKFEPDRELQYRKLDLDSSSPEGDQGVKYVIDKAVRGECFHISTGKRKRRSRKAS